MRIASIVRRWFLGVVVAGAILPLGLLGIFVWTETGSISANLIVGRGELFLLAGSAVLGSLISGSDPARSRTIGSETVIWIATMIVTPCFAIWALGTARSLGDTDPPLSPALATWVGGSALLAAYLCSLAIHVASARRATVG